MKTTVFAHRGFVGIKSDPKAEGLLNDPTKPGQLGFVCDAAYVLISPEALILLKKVPKSRDSLGDVDVFPADDKKIIFSWLGGPLKLFHPKDVSGSRDYDASLLSASAEEIDIDPSFKEAVDERLAKAAK